MTRGLQVLRRGRDAQQSPHPRMVAPAAQIVLLLVFLPPEAKFHKSFPRGSSWALKNIFLSLPLFCVLYILNIFLSCT